MYIILYYYYSSRPAKGDGGVAVGAAQQQGVGGVEQPEDLGVI